MGTLRVMKIVLHKILLIISQDKCIIFHVTCRNMKLERLFSLDKINCLNIFKCFVKFVPFCIFSNEAKEIIFKILL